MGGGGDVNDIEIKKIPSKQTYDFILNKHYAQRKPSISYAFGLFINGMLEGVCTIGKPASNSLCVGVCGVEYSKNVYELNRLVVNDGLLKNTLSQFVGEVLRQLNGEKIILISYADQDAGHHGYIYQATNWLYTGKTKGRTDKYMPGNKHSRHYTEEFSHLRKFRSEKYRYVYIPNKRFKKEVLQHLNYPVIKNYPKGNNVDYELGQRIKQKIINTVTNEIYYE